MPGHGNYVDQKSKTHSLSAYRAVMSSPRSADWTKPETIESTGTIHGHHGNTPGIVHGLSRLWTAQCLRLCTETEATSVLIVSHSVGVMPSCRLSPVINRMTTWSSLRAVAAVADRPPPSSSSSSAV